MPVRKALESDHNNVLDLLKIWDNEEKYSHKTKLDKLGDHIRNNGVYLYYDETSVNPIGVMIISEEQSHLDLHTLFVHPENRSKGIGTEFLSELTSLLNQRCKDAFLLVEPNNPAIHLYERFGFKEDQMRSSHAYQVTMVRAAPEPRDYSI